MAHALMDAGADIHSNTRKVDVRLPGKGNSNSNGARPVQLIIIMIKWIRTYRCEDVAHALVDAGANVNAKNNAGLHPQP